VITEPVDSLDAEWENGGPTYRVYFWHQPLPPPGVAQESMGYHCEPWRVREARDLFEVAGWARGRARGRTFTLYVEHTEANRLGLIRLAGADPTDASGGESSAAPLLR
jgi:hypothetical protein